MKQSKSVSIYAIIITLIFLFSILSPIVFATDFHVIKGTLFIDDEVADSGIEIILDIPEKEFTTTITTTDPNPYNFYAGFDDETYGCTTVYFTVLYEGYELIPVDNASLVLDKNDDPIEVYIIDLHVYLPVNSPPNKPSLIAPENGSTVDFSDSATLEVQVTDADEDTLDVYFYDDSDDSLIDKVLGVASGGTASVLWSGLSPDTIYFWYAVAYDSEYETKSDVWNFRTNPNQPPNKPMNPSPEDGAQNIDVNPYLIVDVSDPDGDAMDVSFYNASNDDLIGTDSNVASGETAMVQWTDLSYNTVYSWYAVADDSTDQTKSDTWSFTTKKVDNKKPKVSITQPERGLYIFNNKILRRFIRPALIIGTITVKANATDEDSGIEKVVFYINGKEKWNDTTEPYEYEWKRDRIRLFHIFVIKVVAYDNDGAKAQDRMLVRKFL